MSPSTREPTKSEPTWVPLVSAAMRARASELAQRRRHPSPTANGVAEVRVLNTTFESRPPLPLGVDARCQS